MGKQRKNKAIAEFSDFRTPAERENDYTKNQQQRKQLHHSKIFHKIHL